MMLRNNIIIKLKEFESLSTTDVRIIPILETTDSEFGEFEIVVL